MENLSVVRKKPHNGFTTIMSYKNKKTNNNFKIMSYWITKHGKIVMWEYMKKHIYIYI